MDSGLRIEPLTSRHSDQTLSFVACGFSSTSTLHKALAISTEELYEQLQADWLTYAFTGPTDSFIAIDANNAVRGFIVTTPFPVEFKPLESKPEKFQAISALLQALENQYLSGTGTLPGNSLLVDIALVHQSVAGRGIYQALRIAVHQQAAERGYSAIYGELSATATQHVCTKKFGHLVVAEIRFDEFEFQNNTPFSGITDPPSIQLVAGNF